MEGPTISSSATNGQVSAVIYGALFMATHLIGVVLIGVLLGVSGIPRPPWIGLLLILGCGYLVSQVFGHRRRRLFTSQETWGLIGLCSGYLFLFEAYAASVRGWTRPGSAGTPISETQFLYIVALTVLLNTAEVVAFFKFMAPKSMTRYLDDA